MVSSTVRQSPSISRECLPGDHCKLANGKITCIILLICSRGHLSSRSYSNRVKLGLKMRDCHCHVLAKDLNELKWRERHGTSQ